MLFDLIVLDMAGTTVRDNDAVNYCLQQALMGYGYRANREQINRVMGMPKPLAIRTLLGQLGGNSQDEVQVSRIHDDFLQAMVLHYRQHPDVGEIPGAAEVLLSLRRMGLKTALDTGFSRPIAQTILERLRWLNSGLLDATVTSDEVAQGRPYPDLILRAMSLTGVTDAARVIKVGDTPSDLLQGKAAGCGLVVGVTYGSHTAAELEVHPHTHLIDDIRQLPALVRDAQGQ